MTMPTDGYSPGLIDAGPQRPLLIGLGEHATSPAVSLPFAQRRAEPLIVQDERNWRQPAVLDNGGRSNLRLFAARWVGADLSEKKSEIAGDYHMLSVSLRSTEFSIWLGTTLIPNKKVIPGTIQLTQPAVPARIVYHDAYDVLHVFIQNVLLKEFFAWSYGKVAVGDVVLRDPSYAYDPAIGRLAFALLSAEELGTYGGLYADSLSMAIVSRLFSLYAERPASTAKRDVTALPQWRLKRVIDFMEANSGEPITLGDLAEAACLSRMHFAAQFRKATGLRPHDYLLRRRVEKAKVMLATGSASIADVALSSGFSSQSHFTGVFKRLTGVTPLRWRECCRG